MQARKREPQNPLNVGNYNFDAFLNRFGRQYTPDRGTAVSIVTEALVLSTRSRYASHKGQSLREGKKATLWPQASDNT